MTKPPDIPRPPEPGGAYVAADSAADSDVVLIEPIAVGVVPSGSRRGRHRWVLWLLFALCFAGLLTAAGLVFTARQVTVRIDPIPEEMTLAGRVPAFKIGEAYLVWPGEYTLRAVKSGYHVLERRFTVDSARSRILNLTLEKLPGKLELTLQRADKPAEGIDSAQVFVDDVKAGVHPLGPLTVMAGTRRVRVEAKRYQTLEVSVEIAGMGVSQSLTLALEPAWAELALDSIPPGAAVRVGDARRGRTPANLELDPGAHRVRLSAAGYRPWETQLTLETGEQRTLPTVRLQPANGTLALTTQPAGAAVTIDGQYAGQTPLEIALSPGEQHGIGISKAGYESAAQTVVVATAAKRRLHFDLKAVSGRIVFKVTPADAQLRVNGQPRGALPPVLELPAAAHELEIWREGYQPHRTQVTPRPGFALEVAVALEKIQAPVAAVAPEITAANGYRLRLIRPGTLSPAGFTMGSSRREQGRRSNETLRKVVLKRPFYMGLREVTNQELRAFQTTHSAGAVGPHALNGDDLPAVEVTWEQAAGFCNWLSAQAKLTPAYVQQGDTLVATDPLGTGFRLPTEAEWALCARRQPDGSLRKYAWGNTFPPTTAVVNVADRSARGVVALYIAPYDDGYAVSAPVGRFAANALGFFDLGGNAAEWCHDYYTIYTYDAARVYTDPQGPPRGKHHVIRGASWRSGTISALRLAYRDYHNGQRPDLGFRVCRYAEAAP